MCRSIGANESAALRYAARPTLGGEPPARPRWCDQIFNTGGKSALSLFGTQLCPSPFARLWEAVWRFVKSPKTRSCYEHHPPGRSKTVRTAVGRSIFPADGIVAPRNQRPEREGQQIAR